MKKVQIVRRLCGVGHDVPVKGNPFSNKVMMKTPVRIQQSGRKRGKINNGCLTSRQSEETLQLVCLFRDDSGHPALKTL